MSRILNLPTRYPELGRLRSGAKDKSSRSGMKALETWRFTSPDRERLEAVARIYGGDVQAWADRQGEWEVFTESAVLDVQLPGDSIYTAYEKWGSGGNQRRCDGETCIVPVQGPDGGSLESVECYCDAKGYTIGDPKNKDACTVTVRLKVVLPLVPGVGVWMFTSGSIYAAMELPAQVDLIDGIRQQSGVLIPCKLGLEHRTEKRSYEKFTREYNVPTLTINESIDTITSQISGLARQRSISPMASGESAAPVAALAPAPAPGLPEAPGEPPPGSGDPKTAIAHERAAGLGVRGNGPPYPQSQAWTKAKIDGLCEIYGVAKGTQMREGLDNLVEAGIIK